MAPAIRPAPPYDSFPTLLVHAYSGGALFDANPVLLFFLSLSSFSLPLSLRLDPHPSEICTVAAFTAEQSTQSRFSSLLVAPFKAGTRSSIIAGLCLGFSQFMEYASYALGFWYGAKLIRDGEMTFEEVFRVFGTLVYAAMAAGQISSANTDAAKAKLAANYIFFLIDRKPSIDVASENGRKEPIKQVNVQLGLG